MLGFSRTVGVVAYRLHVIVINSFLSVPVMQGKLCANAKNPIKSKALMIYGPFCTGLMEAYLIDTSDRW